jgi:DNA-binding transcriptional MerR regulator
MNGTGPLFSISAVAKMLDVPVATLRTWEDRYSLVVPERTPSKHRLFTREQVDQLQFVKAQMDQGASAADAHRLLRERLENPDLPQEPATQVIKRPLVLLAENDPFSAEFQEYYLSAEGIRSATALDYDSAVKLFETQQPAVVVVELVVSGGLGLDLCRYLKQRSEPPRVLAVSSLDSREQALKAGADSFLLKPLDPVRFMSTINELLGSGSDQSESM